VFADKDEDETVTVTSRERVADFISGVMQAQADTTLGQSDTAVVKHEFVVPHDYNAQHFLSQFRVIKNISSRHGFVI